MTDRDKPQVTATFDSLDVDAKVRPGPYLYMTKANKRVEFPDPGEMPWRKADEFTRDLTGPMPAEEFLLKYLGEDGLAALDAEDFTGYRMQNFMAGVVKHYSAFFGTAGEGDASRK